MGVGEPARTGPWRSAVANRGCGHHGDRARHDQRVHPRRRRGRRHPDARPAGPVEHPPGRRPPGRRGQPGAGRAPGPAAPLPTSRRPVRRAVRDAGLRGARQAGRGGGHRPRDRPGAVRPGGLGPAPAGLHDQAGHRGRRAGRARPRRPGSPPAWSRARRPDRSCWSAAATRPWPRAPRPQSDYPQPATLKALAAATARALRAQGRRSVRLGYDTSLYSGPPLAPGWPMAYITTGNVTAITPLEVDQGRLTPGGAPEDADDPGNFRPRSTDPAGAGGRARSRPSSRRRDPRHRPGRPAEGGARTRPPWPRSPRRRCRPSWAGCCARATT